MRNIPTIDHPSGRWNFTRVTVDGVTYWFSYVTCVAFNKHDGHGPVVRVNEWGPTTGKHLNYIDGGDKAAKAVRVYADGALWRGLIDQSVSR